jgi:hypothetical protein
MASTRFSIEQVDLLAGIHDKDFVYAKINHGFWEYLTFVGCGQAEREHYRPWARFPLYDRSRFSDVVRIALDSLHRKNLALGFSAGAISVKDFSFGLSFGSGDCPTCEDLTLPLHPVVKGAAIGCASFFAEMGGADCWHVSDGCAPKSLFSSDQLGHLFERLSARSDALVFIVPPHLASIALRGWNGPSFAIVVPGQNVNELWPAVLPTLIGMLDRVLSKYPRVSILAQAAETAGLLGIVLCLLRGRHPTCVTRYIDLGQVLDVAASSVPDAGPWVRRPDVQAVLRRRPAPPIYLRE